MTDVEELVERVVKESGRSKGEIKAKMHERKEKTHGLLSDYGAIYAVAKECGIDLSESETVVIPLSKVKPSNSVNIIGRVKTVYSEREFARKDGSRGKFASIVVADATGETRIVLWDNNTAIVGKLRVGDVVSVRNGYAKDNRGQLEVHAGPLTNITINPTNVKVALPEVEERIDSIKGLEACQPSVNIVCRVTNYYPKAEFNRPDGTKGSRASFVGEDESGSVRVVLWNPLSELELLEGDIVKLENAYTREGLNGEVELHAGGRSRIVKTDAKLKLKPLAKRVDTVKVKEIKPDMSGFNLECRVLRVYEPREYSKGVMASIIVGDATGTIRAVLWNERSDAAKKLKEGDPVRIRNAYSKANMNGEVEAHLGKYSDVVVDAKIKVPTQAEINETLAKEKRIVDLDVSDSFVRIKGKIMGIEDRQLVYMTCPECNKKVQSLGGEWMCDSCGVIEGTPNMMVSVVVEDDTGNIRAIAFKDKAERILGMDLEEAMNIIGETQDEKAPIAQARERITGNMITLLGKANYNEYSDQLEFMVNEIV
ncbi:MAG: OB-fold nucleic acid binding domain-containing protein [Candidatus Altiarchaeota archaeon]